MTRFPSIHTLRAARSGGRFRSPHRVCDTSRTKFLRVVSAVGSALVLLIPGAFAQDLIEGGNKLQLAGEIDKRYVIPLGLKGKTGTQAIEIVLSEGFQCDIEPISAIGLNEPPLSECEKRPSGFGDLCDKLIVTLRFEKIQPPPSRTDMIQQLDTMKVKSALPFCPYTPEVSVEYLAQRKPAEETLAQQVDAYRLTGNARHAYEKLLIEGFYCGFAFAESNKDPMNMPKLVCFKRPTGIKFCFESKIVMDIAWPPAATSGKQLFSRLNLSEVHAVHSSCEIPAIKRTGQAL
jgi:hypothetical protein